MAWKIAKGLYIVPLLIAFTPFLGGSVIEVLEIFFFGCLGIYALNGALDGFLEAPVNWLWRIVLLAAAVGLFWPNWILAHLIGLAIFALAMAINLRARWRGGAAVRASGA